MSESNGLLTKEAIFGSLLDTRDVQVPEWGGTVRVRGMTGAERDDWELRAFRAEEANDLEMQLTMRRRAVVCGVIDAGGAAVFNDEDTAEIKKLSGKALEVVFDAIMKLSGLRKESDQESNQESKDDNSAVDSEKKSLKQTPSSSSGTD